MSVEVRGVRDACLLRILPVVALLLACNAARPRSEPTEVAPLASVQPATTCDPMSPELVTFASGSLTLHGFLYRPSGTGPFPAIVFNHGSEQLPGPKDGQAMFYVAHGFVLFVPHRRGHGHSADAGAYIGNTPTSSPAMVDALIAQSDDVMAAVAYVASLPYADAKRIAVAGCSFGGIESLLAAERGTGIASAIDFAGGAMMWASNPTLQERMKSAARNARVPVFFIQAENDFDTSPSRVLSDEMKRSGKPTRVHIFPPNGTTHAEGHGFCMGGEHPAWGEEVLQFLTETMR